MLKLILAVSEDGYLAKGRDDDMSWTLQEDKKVFRLLTSVGSGILAAGSRTADLLPRLPGREVIRLTTQPQEGSVAELNRSKTMSLGRFVHLHPGAWLLGGPTIAREALSCGMVREAFMMHQKGVRLYGGLADVVTPMLQARMGRPNTLYESETLQVVRWAE